jgi:phosphoglycerate dehydrogenase-like enzyme
MESMTPARATRLTIATLDVVLPQQARLAKLLDFPHEFVDPSEDLQNVDAVVALRFGTDEAQRFSTRLLHLPGAGADAVDFDSLTRGCEVCNVFEHEIPIAEYVITAILSHTLAYQPMQAAFDAERWQESYAARRMHGEVFGRTVGLVGFGHIGQAVTQRAKAFGMRVHAISNSGRADGADWAGDSSQLAQMLPVVDFLVMACPLTSQTRGMLGVQQLALLKPTAILINIGRAQLVDEEALYMALSGGRLAGATLDVWYDYPTPERPDARPSRFPFEKLPNVQCTAHSCAWTPGLLDRRYAVIADNLARLFRGAPLRNVIFTAR